MLRTFSIACVLALTPVIGACLLALDTSERAVEDTGPDAGADAEGDGCSGAACADTGSDAPNACGGIGPLRFGERERDPGAACGCSGVLVCDGPNRLRCEGDRNDNACGGCSPLPAEPGEPCGRCEGTWRCDVDDDERLWCDTEANDCGGCTELDAVPGTVCAMGDDAEGIWACDGLDELVCRPPGGNACGGLIALDNLPGEPCGECQTGVLVCETSERVECVGQVPAKNVCGGCGRLPGAVDEACDECGGTWQCDGQTGSMSCRPATRNACGGCAELALAPGDACEGGELRCQGPDALVCDPRSASNACGGSANLDVAPGETCGACGDGLVVCASPDEVVCVGGTEANECGSCATPAVELGARCAAGRVWRCDDDETGVNDDGIGCLLDGNVCGGQLAITAGEPWGVCPPCETGRWACDGDGEALVCVDIPDAEPTSYWPDRDEDGRGDRDSDPVQRCAPARFFADNARDCDDAVFDVHESAEEIPGNERDDNCDGRELCFEDRDNDGYLADDAGTVISINESCGDRNEGSESTPRGDCDDGEASVNPGAADVCNNCDDEDDEGC